MANVILETLIDYLDTYKDYCSTGNTTESDLNEAKKRFIKSLSDFIDYKIKIDHQVKRKKSGDIIDTVDSINSNLKSTANTIKSMSALNSAPPPPDDLSNIETWLSEYKVWFNTKREEGIKIK